MEQLELLRLSQGLEDLNFPGLYIFFFPLPDINVDEQSNFEQSLRTCADWVNQANQIKLTARQAYGVAASVETQVTLSSLSPALTSEIWHQKPVRQALKKQLMKMHLANGPLYIGISAKRPISDRLKEHNDGKTQFSERVRHAFGDLSILERMRIAWIEAKSDWDEQYIFELESLLIYLYRPPFNQKK
ncbi:MAG TPA: hypothetical protein PLZ57_07320 [Pseudobdellovibrionaceae bacterium]|nr:hypothetical protein [Pseudobdellovibrionaceae bacterium]